MGAELKYPVGLLCTRDLSGSTLDDTYLSQSSHTTAGFDLGRLASLLQYHKFSTVTVEEYICNMRAWIAQLSDAKSDQIAIQWRLFHP